MSLLLGTARCAGGLMPRALPATAARPFPRMLYAWSLIARSTTQFSLRSSFHTRITAAVGSAVEQRRSFAKKRRKGGKKKPGAPKDKGRGKTNAPAGHSSAQKSSTQDTSTQASSQPVQPAPPSQSSVPGQQRAQQPSSSSGSSQAGEGATSSRPDPSVTPPRPSSTPPPPPPRPKSPAEASRAAQDKLRSGAAAATSLRSFLLMSIVGGGMYFAYEHFKQKQESGTRALRSSCGALR